MGVSEDVKVTEVHSPAPVEQDAVEEASTFTRIKNYMPKLVKLFFVLTCYTALFYVILNQARWFLRGWETAGPPVDFIGWVKCLPECGPSWKDVLKKLAWNVGLFLVFVAQHSLLAERNLSGTRVHQKLYIEWKVNGALYTLATAAALHILVTNWCAIPIYLWRLPIQQPLLHFIHFLAWLSLYGTTLMQDMPELIGLNQVVFTNHSTSVKSEKFKAMLKRQRHLGFVPFTVLILISNVMTLDRFLYLIVLSLYSYIMWQDPDSYDYIKEMTCRKKTRLSGGGKTD